MTIRRTPAPPVSHQIVELAPGKHSSPEKGACVVELASMLAGERFTDHPRSVCPVIASFMRTLNDDLDDDRRRELLPYASMIVGTRGTRTARARRAQLCLSWAERLGASPGRMSRFLARWFGEQQGARVCAKAAMRHGVPVALTLVDALIVEGGDAEQPAYVRQLTPLGDGTRERVVAD